MFKDYYAILDVSLTATQKEIKDAFKTQALKWHPDRNVGIDTTLRMQEINEGYLILKDSEGRERYNIEYQNYRQYQRQQHSQQDKQSESVHQQKSEQKEKPKEKTYSYSDYKVDDDILKKWMDNAKKQSVDLAKQTIKDFKGMVNVGTKAAVKEAGNMIAIQITLGVIILVIIALVKTCN